MNPLLRSYLEQLDRQVEEIESQVESLEERYAKERARADRMRSQYWNRGKTLSVLQQSAEDVTRLQEENARFREAQATLEERLERVLGYAKALGEGLRA